MSSPEQKLWRKVQPGGKTKENIERGDSAYGELQTADDLARELDAARRRLLKSETVETLPKSSEEIEFIGLMQTFISQERKELGLEPGFFIRAERVRFFHPEVWNSPDEQRGGNRGDAAGLYNIAKDTADVRRNPEKGSYSHFAALAHELRHQAAYFETDVLGGNFAYKTGYRNRKEGTGWGLDEALTEEPVHEYFERYKSTICERLGISPPASAWDYKDFFWLGNAYDYYRTVVKTVVAEVDKKLYNGEQQTWNNLKRGYLSGDAKGLEDIQKVLSADAYRLFQAMGNWALFDVERYMKEHNLWEKQAKNILDLNIQRYFTNELKLSEERRAELLKETLAYVKDMPDKPAPDAIESGKDRS